MLPTSIINDLPQTFSLAIKTSPENHHQAFQIIDLFHHPGLCLSLEKTSFNLRRLLYNQGISQKKVHIIDPLSRVIGSMIEAPETTHIPYTINHMLEAIEKKIQEYPLKERFIIIDAVHALPLIYDNHTITQFLNTLDNKAKIHHAKVIYTYQEEKIHDTMKEELHHLVDKVIEI